MVRCLFTKVAILKTQKYWHDCVVNICTSEGKRSHCVFLASYSLLYIKEKNIFTILKQQKCLQCFKITHITCPNLTAWFVLLQMIKWLKTGSSPSCHASNPADSVWILLWLASTVMSPQLTLREQAPEFSLVLLPL